jgi:hypothetical protein
MNAKVVFEKVLMTAKEASPTIAVIGGLVLGAAAIVTACSKMGKAQEEKENTESELIALESTEFETKKEKTVAYIKFGAKTAVRYIKIFWLPFVLEILAILSIWYSHGVMVKRNSALASGALVLTQQLDNYRDRVKAKLGEEAENDLFYGIENRKTGTEAETLPNGKTKKHDVFEKFTETGAEGPFDFLFGPSNRNYCADAPGSNFCFLSQVMSSSNAFLRQRAIGGTNGWMTVGEILEKLGEKPTAESYRWGWIYDPKKTYPAPDRIIDFGDFWDKGNAVFQDFINGRADVIPVHFNCVPIDLVKDAGLAR